MRDQCGDFKRKLSMKIYDCRGLSRRLCRLERSAKEVCAILDGAAKKKCKQKHKSCR